MASHAQSAGEPVLDQYGATLHARDASALGPALVLLGGELVLLAVTHWGRVPLGFWLAGHLIVTGAIAVQGWRMRTREADVSALGLTVVAVLIGGVGGALLVTLALLMRRRERPQQRLLAAWYDRIALSGDIDPVTRLADTVAMGRALRTTNAAPRPFADVMVSGSLADRQTALGLIARRFSPAYADALKAALVTGEPVVRVQAAAVAVKVRAELKAAVRAAVADAAALSGADGVPSSGAAGALSRLLRDYIQTGLLEDDDRAVAEEAIVRLVSLAVGGTHTGGFDVAMQHHLETELLRSGNYAGFRALRAAGLVPTGQRVGAAHG